MKVINNIRGFRNNNPDNIRHGDDWLGLCKEQNDADFCQFESVEYGIRAIFQIIDTYRGFHGCNTVETTIYRWAPPLKNDTKSYINTVAGRSGIIANEILCGDDLVKVVEAIIHQENGVQPFSMGFLEYCKNFYSSG